MSGAEFEAYAAASRGAGPISRETTSPAEIAAPEVETEVIEPPEGASLPDSVDNAQALTGSENLDAEPDLSDFQNRPPVEIVTDLPSLGAASSEPSAPVEPTATTPPAATAQPNRPDAVPQDQAAESVAPRSPLALDRSIHPPQRPDDLVEQHNQRLAQQAAERAAEAAAIEAERLAAEEAAQRAAEELAEQRRQEAEQAAAAAAQEEAARQAAAEQAEQERREAELAAERAEQEQREAELAAEAAREAERLASEEAARAEEARQAEAEQQRREAEAESARLAREEEARQAAEERAARAEEERLAAEAEKAAAEAQAAAERQSVEDALREAQNAGSVEGETTGGTDENRQRIEGGTGASVEQDPLAAALAEALSGQRTEPAPPAPNVNQFLPRPINPRPLTNNNLLSTDQAAQPAPLGPPLTMSEREGFRAALARCWNRGALSVEATQLAVSISFRLGLDGRPDPDSLELSESQAGSADAIQNAFSVARRAILQCGQAGFPLPREKYGRWQQVIVDFQPQGINFQ